MREIHVKIEGEKQDIYKKRGVYKSKRGYKERVRG